MAPKKIKKGKRGLKLNKQTVKPLDTNRSTGGLARSTGISDTCTNASTCRPTPPEE
jgi:hypothetical protein